MSFSRVLAGSFKDLCYYGIFGPFKDVKLILFCMFQRIKCSWTVATSCEDTFDNSEVCSKIN